MARYVLLRIEDEREADRLFRHCADFPGQPILSPVVEDMVHVEIVPDLDPADSSRFVASGDLPRDSHGKPSLEECIRASYNRAAELAADDRTT